MKEEGSSRSSTKDSAYGSMDAKVNTTPKHITHRTDNNKIQSRETTVRNSPSRSLSGSSMQRNRSPMSVHAQRIQKSEEVFSKELESLKGSSSTLHSLANSSRSNSLQVTRNSSLDNPSTSNNDVLPQKDSISSYSRPNNPVITQNGFSPGGNTQQNASQGYVSMKATAYDRVNTRNSTNSTPEKNPLIQQKDVPDSPYTSMMNIVQGQIKISPHENETNRNVVNVSVTPFSRNKKT